MIFSSTSFLFVFLPLFLFFYVLFPWRNSLILMFSLIFFSWGEGAYVLLLLFSIWINYCISEKLNGIHSDSRWLAIGVTFNLSLLFYFKYFGFVVTQIFQIDLPETNNPHLLLGISFFTFQSISYLVDVYRGDSPKASSYIDLALYISMFPQLIAGPIVRYSTVALAIRERKIFFVDVFRGVALFIVGLSYKVLIANNVAEVADTVFALPKEDVTTAVAWIGAISYTLQIFFDFSGYSLMAIGLGRIMGFRFPQNFNYPYISQSITEFWRRWHISLSSWFRDYLYIPLGGNRSGKYRTYFNLVFVFLLCGLWHGAAWTFLLWGVYHGIILVVERCGLGQVMERLPRFFRHSYTLLLVVIGWVIFRAESANHAGWYLCSMFDIGLLEYKNLNLTNIIDNETVIFFVIGLLFSMPLIERSGTFHTSLNKKEYIPSSSVFARDLLVCAILLIFCCVYLMSNTYNPFIYFRF